MKNLCSVVKWGFEKRYKRLISHRIDADIIESVEVGIEGGVEGQTQRSIVWELGEQLREYTK